MKKVVFIILALFVAFTGIVYAMQNKQLTNKGVLNMDKKVLVAYFSRTGEQYSVGNITEGNTAIIAKIIADKTNGDLFEIKVKNDNYPKGYTELTEYAKAEKQKNARPKIDGKVDNIDEYDVVFLGYPNWWGDMPMPVYTFLESYDFSNKIIIPFCTHEGSGLSSTPNKIKYAVTAKNVLNGFAIYGHIAQNNKIEADKKVSDWLKELGL